MLNLFLLVSVFTLGGEAPPQDNPADGSKKSDNLATKLIRKTIDESAPEDPLNQVKLDMSEIARRLQFDFDPGEHTQTLQREVSSKLDEAIKAAAARRRAQSKSEPKQQGDKRTLPSAKQTRPKSGEQKQATPQKSKSGSEKEATAEGAENKGTKKSESVEMRRSWGNLPQRDREEVLQGAEEESLERFRNWIDQYFKALQESNH